MAGFRKAKAEQAALKLGMYGPPGSGKTFTALLIAEGLAKITKKRIAYIDTERGTDFYCQSVPARALHPEAFDFDAIYTRSIMECIAATRGINEEDYGVLVLDSITHIWEAAIGAYDGKLTSIGTIPVQAWGKLKKPYKNLMGLLLGSKLHIIICGRQRTVWERDEETEELKATGVTMRAEGETPYEPHILLRMEAIRSKRTNETAQIIAYGEKDRTGILAGRSFVNPTFDMFRPILPLLGDVQGAVEMGDATQLADAEAMAAEEQERARGSTELLRELRAKIDLAKTGKELKAVGATITPALKAKMIPADLATLREHYGERDEKLGGQGETAHA